MTESDLRYCIKGRQTYRTKNYTEELLQDVNESIDSSGESSHSDSESQAFTLSDSLTPNSFVEDSTLMLKSVQFFNRKLILFLSIIIVVLAIIVYGWSVLHIKSVNSCSFEALESQYPNETEKVWETLSVGIHSLISDTNKINLGVYLFLHHQLRYANSFVKAIASKSSACFESNMKPVEMKKEQFLTDGDYGPIIEEFKRITKQTRVVFIGNLNEIPAENARALHTICDTENPLQKKVLIYLTLVPSSISGNPKKIAEETLYNLWGSKIAREELDALIVRVTDEVIQLEGFI